jgi:NAD(P)H-nitrite reductase large subunit
VSSRTILAAVAAGAATVDDVGRACGAGTVCGSCRPTIEALLDAAPARPGAGTDPPRQGEEAGPVR